MNEPDSFAVAVINDNIEPDVAPEAFRLKHAEIILVLMIHPYFPILPAAADRDDAGMAGTVGELRDIIAAGAGFNHPLVNQMIQYLFEGRE